ncbi:MAG: putative DNA-binding domain-containing protein, partial [Gammaproteobacteria bacterium]
MTALQTLQQHFQNYILQQELDFLAEVCGPDKEFAIERLDIYREGYVLRLLEVLTKNFP